MPLTFLLTICRRLAALFTSKTPGKPRKILFIELSEMGSTIIADPAMRKARDVLGAELYFVIFNKNKPSLDLIGTVDSDHIFTIRENNLFALALDTLKFLFRVRALGIDTVVDLELFSASRPCSPA